MRKIGLIIFFLIVLSGIAFLYLLNKSFLKHKNDLAIIASKSISTAPQNNPLTNKLPTNLSIKEFDMTVTDSSYSPNIIKVNKDDVVKISLYSKEGYHNFAISILQIHSLPLATNKRQTFRFVATQSGIFQFNSDTYGFYDNSPEGTLIVQ